MVIRHSVEELLAKNSVTRPMKYIVERNNNGDAKRKMKQCNVYFDNFFSEISMYKQLVIYI